MAGIFHGPLLSYYQTPMTEFEETISISAPAADVWRVLADIGRICQWNPGVVHSEQTSAGDVGVGSTRRCELGGRNFLDEEVLFFDPECRMTIRITNTNLPFDRADIRFRLEASNGSTLVAVSPIYRLKFGWFGYMMDALFARRLYRKGMRDLLEGLKRYVEQAR